MKKTPPRGMYIRVISKPWPVTVQTIKNIHIENFDHNSPLSKLSSDVIEYHDTTIQVEKSTTFSPEYSAEAEKYLAKNSWLELMLEERQLKQNEADAQNFTGLEKCALLIDLTKRWEAWGFKMHTLFKKIDCDEADLYLRSIYVYRISNNYSKTLSDLIAQERNINEQTPEATKKAWSKMIAYTQGKIVPTFSLYENSEVNLKYLINKRNDALEILAKHNLGYLVSDKKEPIKTAAPSLVTTASSVLYAAFSSAASMATNLLPTGYQTLGVSCGPEAVSEREINTQKQQQSLVEKYNSNNLRAREQNAEIVLLSQIQENLAFYQASFVLMSIMRNEVINDNHEACKIIQRYFVTYLHPCMLRITQMFASVLDLTSGIISQAEYAQVWQQIKALHSNMLHHPLPPEQASDITRDLKIIDDKIATLEAALKTLSRPITDKEQEFKLSFPLIDPQSLVIDKFEIALISDNNRLRELKYQLDNCIAQKQTTTQISKLFKELANNTANFIAKLERYYLALPKTTKDAMLNAAKLSLREDGLLLPKVDFSLISDHKHLTEHQLPVISGDHLTLKVNLLEPQLTAATTVDFPYNFQQESLDNGKFYNLDFKLHSLQYFSPTSSNQGHEFSDLMLLRDEAELNLWLETLHRASRAGAAFTPPTDGDKFVSTWNSDNQIISISTQLDYLVQGCRAYIRLGMDFSTLLNNIQQRYAEAGVDSAAVITNMTETYSQEFTKGFFWLEAAIKASAISPQSNAKKMFSELIGATNIGYINLLPDNCLVLKKRLYENYPHGVNEIFANLKVMVHDISHTEMPLKEREILKFKIAISEQNQISKVSFNIKVVDKVNPTYMQEVEFKRRLGKFKFSPNHASLKLTKYDTDILREEARCALFENQLIDAYRQALLSQDAQKKYEIGMQFFRIAQALEGLRNDMDKNSSIDPLQKIQINEFICEKLAMAYDALSDAVLTKQADFKPNPQEYNGVATKLCAYMRNDGVGRQYLIGGVLLESQLAIDKIFTFKDEYPNIVNDGTLIKPSSGLRPR